MSRKRYKGIKRLNMTTDPELLGEGEVSALENMTLDSEYGKAIKRGGFIANSLTDDVIGSDETNTIFGATIDNTDYVVAKNNHKLMKQSSGGFTEVGTNEFSASNKIDHAQYRDDIFIVGEDESSKWTDLTNVESLGVERVDVSGIKLESIATGMGGTGLTDDSRYKYIFTYITDKGEESKQSNPITYYIDDNGYSTDSTHKRIGVGKDTTIPASTDPRVIGIKIYRTKANGETFYFLERLENVDSYYVDKTEDTDLSSLTLEYLENPSQAKHCELHQDRLFLANIKTKANNLIMPAIGGKDYGLKDFYGTPNVGGTNTYKYLCVFETESGVQSEPVYSKDVTSVGDIGVGAEEVGLELIPIINTAYLDTFNLTQVVYRTKKNGSVYYKLFSNSGVMLSGDTDSTEDDDLGDVFVAQADINYDSSIVFSEIGKPVELPALNIIRVYPDDGDEITGIISDRDRLLVFKENSICAISTNGNIKNWRVSKLLSNMGMDEPFSLQKAGATYYFSYKNKIYRYPNELISKPIEISGDFKGSAYFDNWYVYLTVVSSTDTRLYVYDEVVGSWYIFKIGYECTNIEGIRGILAIASKKVASNSFLLRYGDTNGDFNPVDETDNNTPFTAKIVFPKMLTNRLRDKFRMAKLLARYTKFTGQDVSHSVNSATFLDNVSSGEKNIEQGIGTFTSPFTHARTLEYTVQGSGLKEFDLAELEFWEIRRR